MEQSRKRLFELGPQGNEAARPIATVRDHAREAQHLHVVAERRVRDASVKAAPAALTTFSERFDDGEAHGVAQRSEHFGERDLVADGMAVLPHRGPSLIFDVHRT